MVRIKFICTLVAILLGIVQQSTAAVSDTACANGNEDCTVPNSECDGDAMSPKCKCTDGYKEDSNGGNTCVKVPVSDTLCPGGDTDCLDDNSVCNTDLTPAKCTCSGGYKEDSNDGSTCVDNVISNNECAPGDAANGNTKCQGVDPNAVCPSDGTHCACTANYFLSTEKTTCIQKISTIDCTPGDVTEGSTKCQDLDANSECPAEGVDKCACKAGYKGTDSCSKVLAGQCTTHGDCTSTVDNSECSSLTCSCVAGFKEVDNLCEKVLAGNCTSNEECTGTVANSECSSSSICFCKAGFIEVGNVCKKGVGEVCTSNEECVTNAECKTTCQCTSDYVDNNGICVVPSLATSTWTTTGLLVTSLFMYLLKLLNLI